MFYNHEILTSRKYGIATVWLVATLGSKSSLRKINRRAISEVDIVKACETITEPAVPMALRLQSNLLFGVTRVYDQQCTFVLTELQSLEKTMTQAMRAVARKELDLEVGRAVRPDQLLLEDDPSYLPDFAFDNLLLDANLDVPGLDHTRDDASQSSITHSPRTPRASLLIPPGYPQIVIPTSDSVGGAGFGFSSHGGRFSDMGRSTLGPLDDGVLLDDPGFAFDADGGIIHGEPQDAGPHLESTPLQVSPAAPYHQRAGSDASALANVRKDQEEARRAAPKLCEPMDMDMGVVLHDDYNQMPDAEPFPERQRQVPASSNILRSSSIELASEEAASSATAEAAQRRKSRGPHLMKPDPQTEVNDRVIAGWIRDYLANMAKDAAQKATSRAHWVAKKNAEYYVWIMGIAGIGQHLSTTNLPSPLDIFYGDKLFGFVTRSATPLPKLKRRHASITDSGDDESRRVKPRGESMAEIGRADDEINLDDPGFVLDDDMEPEIGRDAPTPLDANAPGDPSSLMPWNMSASQRSLNMPGSAIPFARPSHGLSRAPSVSSVTPLPMGLGGHRLTSASPLFGHGMQLPSRQGSLAPQLPFQQFAAATSSIGGGDVGLTGDDDGEVGFTGRQGQEEAMNQQEEFELFGPAANVDTQTAGQSQWIRKTLDHESESFLAFVGTSLADLNATDGPTVASQIKFAELLEPERNSHVVAAQGLLHCLTLATKGLLRVQQEEHYGDIWLSLAPTVKP